MLHWKVFVNIKILTDPKKEIIANIKKISPSTDILFKFSDHGLTIYNSYQSAGIIQEILFSITFERKFIFCEFLCESKKPENTILFKINDDFNNLTQMFGKLEEKGTPSLFLQKEQTVLSFYL